MYYWEEIIDIVSAANIAGHMENAGTITLSDDEELAMFIQRQMKLYSEASYKAQDDYPGDDRKWPNWYDWITDALREEYAA